MRILLKVCFEGKKKLFSCLKNQLFLSIFNLFFQWLPFIVSSKCQFLNFLYRLKLRQMQFFEGLITPFKNFLHSLQSSWKHFVSWCSCIKWEFRTGMEMFILCHKKIYSSTWIVPSLRKFSILQIDLGHSTDNCFVQGYKLIHSLWGPYTYTTKTSGYTLWHRTLIDRGKSMTFSVGLAVMKKS